MFSRGPRGTHGLGHQTSDGVQSEKRRDSTSGCAWALPQ